MIAAAVLALTVAACPIERATYGLRHTPAVTAHFEPAPRSDDWPLGVVLVVHGARSDQTIWWLPWPGGTDQGSHVRLAYLRDAVPDWARQRRAGADTDFFTANRAYDFDQALPRHGGGAPAHLLIPDLDLWHSGSFTRPRDGSPRAFFDRTGCHRSTRHDRGLDVILPPL